MLGVVFGAFVVLLFLGLPIAGSMIFATLIPSFAIANFPGNVNYTLRAVVSGLDTMSILAIPLFMLSGAIMAQGGISRKLFDVFAVFIGKFKAGMPCAVVVTCLFYGAISGSSPATVAAVGAMCIPVLTELGYDKKFAAAIVATAGGLGVIIPPSIPFIMYGVTTGESVGDMFTAGIIPGILIAVCLMVYCVIYCIRHGEDKALINGAVDALRSHGYIHVIMWSGMYMNLDFYNSLPDDYKALVNWAVQDVYEPFLYEDSIRANDEALQTMKEAGLEVIDFSSEDLAKMREAAQPAYDLIRQTVGDEPMDLIAQAQANA